MISNENFSANVLSLRLFYEHRVAETEKAVIFFFGFFNFNEPKINLFFRFTHVFFRFIRHFIFK